MDHPDHALDAIDRRILEVMQLQGRITFDELAAQVQLSASAVLRRVRRLEEAGVITGYAAIVPPERLGLGLTALVDVRLALPGEGCGPAERFREIGSHPARGARGADGDEFDMSQLRQAARARDVDQPRRHQPAFSFSSAFMLRRILPRSSVSRTLTRTTWPSLT